MNLVALIKPNKKIFLEVKKYKGEVFKKFGKQTYVDHLPHLTIFNLKINSKINLKNEIKIKNLKLNELKIIIKKRYYFESDPITKKITFILLVKKNKTLQRIQDKLLLKFKKFKKLEKLKFKNKEFNRNYRIFGYPFVNKNWKPHLTIASVNNSLTSDNLFKKFLSSKKILKENFRFVYFYKYTKGRHIFLKKAKLVNEK